MLQSLTVRRAGPDELDTIASFWIAMFEEVGNYSDRDHANPTNGRVSQGKELPANTLTRIAVRIAYLRAAGVRFN